MFTSTKTDDGFCCSFNTVSLAEGFATPDGEAESGDEYDDDDDDGNYVDPDYYTDMDINTVSQASFDTW